LRLLKKNARLATFLRKIEKRGERLEPPASCLLEANTFSPVNSLNGKIIDSKKSDPYIKKNPTNERDCA